MYTIFYIFVFWSALLSFFNAYGEVRIYCEKEKAHVAAEVFLVVFECLPSIVAGWFSVKEIIRLW